MANEPVDLHAENEHLRKQLDTLPNCLMRIGTDDIVLAANDAARNLLGAASLSEVLNMPFTAWIANLHHEPWRQFTARVASGSAASLECEITALSGAHRSTLLHGIPVLDHPDRLPSMLVAARDVSDRREIETSLEEREGKIRELEFELNGLQSQLTRAVTDRDQIEERLRVLSADHDAQCRRLGDQISTLTAQQDTDQRDADRVAAEQSDERRCIEAALRDQLAIIEQLEADKRALQEEVERLRADGERLAASIRQLEAERDTEHAAHAAQRDRYEQEARQLTERFEHDTRLLTERHQRQIEDSTDASRRWQAESLGQRAAIEQLEALLRAKEHDLAQLGAEHGALLEQLELRERQHTERPVHTPEPSLSDDAEREAEQEARRQVEVTQAAEAAHAQLEATLGERSRAVDELTTERDRLRQDRDRARAARAALEQSLSDLDHERLRLIAGHEAERARLLGEVGAAASSVRHLEERLESKEAAVARLEADLANAVSGAEQRHRETVDAHDRMRETLETQLRELRASHERVETEMRQLETARQRLEALAQEAESQSRQHEAALEETTRALRSELASQAALLEQAVTERRRLHSTLQMRDIATQALIAERASERQKHQQALALAAAEQRRLVKLVADQHVELTALTDEAHGTSQLATAGRLAMDVGRDLRQLLDDIDAHAKRLLVECPVDGPGRRGIETLRADAMRAASLARQFLQAASGAQMFPGADSVFTDPQRRM